ncbi:MAG: FtsX-like permease family protein [Planctomycetes bacterium]|nr:FtsX-like permease family protein [Planctomycetota bacterium]
MLPTWRLALNTLAGRRTRTVLMSGAVWLAACLVVAVSCTMSSANAGVEARLERFIGAADVRIIHPGNGRFDEAVLATAATWPGVTLAAGRLGASLTLVHADHRLDAGTGAMKRLVPGALGVDFEHEQRIRPYILEAGRVPERRDEILLDSIAADGLDAGIGDILEIFRFGPKLSVTVVGIRERQRMGMLQEPRVYVDRGLLAEATDRPGALTSVYLDLEDDSDPQAFCERHGVELPEPLVLEPAERVRAGFDQSLRAAEFAMILTSVLVFMCAAFIILTGLTSGVTERQRELALLRCVGARRGQLFGAQVLVGLIFGTIGAAGGVPSGIAMTAALVAMYPEYIPDGVRVETLGLMLGVIGSLLAGAAGAAWPAVMASRVTPLRAMASATAPVRPATIAITTIVGLALVGVQVALTQFDDRDTRYWAYATVGLPILFTGWFLLAVPILILVTRLLAGLLSGLLRLPRDLVGGMVLATPLRHGFTAAALMVGMALLVASWSSGLSVQRDWLDRIKFADAFARDRDGISPEEQRAIADLPFVTSTCPISYLPVRVIDQQVFGLRGLTPSVTICVGFDPERFFAMNHVEWIEGEPDDAIPRVAAGDAVVVAERFLVARDLGFGDEITLGVGRTKQTFDIAGVVRSPGLDLIIQLFGIRSAYTDMAQSCCFMDFDTVGRMFDNHDALMLQLNLDEGVSDEDAERGVVDAVPGIDFRSGRWIRRTVNDIASGLLTVQITIAFAALALAAIAVGNVIAADVRGRRYELGVLRATGARRRWVIGLIGGEAVLLAVTGVVVGTMFGAHLAWMDARNLRDLAGLPVRVILPPGPLLVGALVLLVLTLLAALPAAWSVVRASPARMVAAGRNE